jgi:hypothetical protein
MAADAFGQLAATAPAVVPPAPDFQAGLGFYCSDGPARFSDITLRPLADGR